MAMMAVGSLLLSVLVRALGLDAALAIIGAVTAVGLLLGAARFRQLGGDVPPPPDHVVERVLADPVFAYLGGPAAAHLADRVEIVCAQPGDVVITEGEPGDRYYLVVDGRLVATIGDEVVGEMAAGGSFGEIALLRDIPRTATVTCVTAVELFAISRDDFLTTLTGHPRSLATATQIADGMAPPPNPGRGGSVVATLVSSRPIRATSTTWRSLAHWSSSVIWLPWIVLENPHWGLRHIRSRSTYSAASWIRARRRSLSARSARLDVTMPSTNVLSSGKKRNGAKSPDRSSSYSRKYASTSISLKRTSATAS